MDVGAREVRVTIKASGVCHSDLGTLNSPADLPPMVLGHEGAGVVEEIGASVEHLRVGDRVIASWVQPCGRCSWCLHGQTYLCAQWDQLSPGPRWTRSDGSEAFTMGGLGTFAESMVVKEQALVRVSTDLPDEQLSLIGCGVTTGVCAALNAAAVKPGSTVVVIGCGGVGQAAVQGARIAGAAQIIAVDPVQLKRDAALGFGATEVIDPGASDPVEQVLELTRGRGADYVLEVVGRGSTIDQGYRMARRGGLLVLVGGPPADTRAGWSLADQMKESKTVVGALYGHAEVHRDFPMIVDLAERGLLDVDGMVSRRIPLDEIGASLEALERGEVLRSVVLF